MGIFTAAVVTETLVETIILAPVGPAAFAVAGGIVAGVAIAGYFNEKNKKRAEDERRAKQDKARKEKEKRAQQDKIRKEKEKEAMAAPGSSQPPQRNENKKDQKQEPDYYKIFLEILEKLLKRIYGSRNEPFTTIFKNLPPGQKKYLVTIIRRLKIYGSLEAVIELVIKLFKEHYPDDITFANFLSLMEFVQVYINEEVVQRIAQDLAIYSIPTMTFEEMRTGIINAIINERDLFTTLKYIFNELRRHVEAETSQNNIVDFRDIFAAVYHYYKHKDVNDDKTLSVDEYYDLIRKLLEKLQDTSGYREFINNSKVKKCSYGFNLTDERGRRFKFFLVIKKDPERPGKVVVCSAYVVPIFPALPE